MTVTNTRSAWRAVPERVLRRAQREIARRRQERLVGRLAGPKILRAFAEVYPNAFFVEIGANDGEQHDHLRPILDGAAWRGIMVEPVPYVFERLRVNYASRPNITLANVAIADHDGEMPFYHLEQVGDRESAGLPQWYDGIGSFSKEAVLGHIALVPGLQDRLRCVSVPCLTFESLCRHHGVDDVDLLLIDTEGYDHEILRHLDWTVRRPRLVVYEHYHLSDEVRAELRAALSARGYELKEEGFDTWCLHTDVRDQLTTTFRGLSPGLPAQSASEDR